jgi:hypothetical protein
MGLRRWWRGNAQTITSVVFGTDELSAETQGRLARLTNPASPQCQGTHMYWFQGDRGFSNRFGGALPNPLQDFRGAASPIAKPDSIQTGTGLSGSSSASSLPYTNLPGIDGSLATMSGLI